MNNIASVQFHTFGCKLNYAETATMADVFAKSGIKTVSKNEVPDFVVINSCSVTAEADRKCRSTIRNFNRRYPNAGIIVTGCYAQLKPDEVSKLPGVIIVAGVNGKLDIANMAIEWLKSRQSICRVPLAKDLTDFVPSCARGDRTRYFLKVQDGCDYWCTYCTIPKARGRSRSGSINQIVEQAKYAAAQGGKEIVITGVNIGDFGKGRIDSFIDLCQELDKVEGIERYRISSIEPNLLTDELIEFVASSRTFMPHFHIPLQSGSDKVLEMMHRRYSTELFAHKVARIRQIMPHAFIGVDLIVGARGETSEEFEISRDFVQNLDISHLHVFPYSERPGTRALQIDSIVDQTEKHRRAHIMGEISANKHKEFAFKFIGSTRPVLLEKTHKGNSLSGFTDNYLRLNIEGNNEFDNHIVNAKLLQLLDDGETIYGEIC